MRRPKKRSKLMSTRKPKREMHFKCQSNLKWLRLLKMLIDWTEEITMISQSYLK